MAAPSYRRTINRFLLPVTGGIVSRVVSGGARLAAAALLVSIGIVHLVLAPQYYPAAAYVGILFYATAAASLLTALAIAVGVRGAWLLGGLIAAGAFAGLLLSVTVGLPGFNDSLSAPWAVLSLVLEGALVVLFLGLVVVRRNLLLAPRT